MDILGYALLWNVLGFALAAVLLYVAVVLVFLL
jgi:hypothetical protein